MEEIVNSVIEAEKQANKIREDAVGQAAKIVLEGESAVHKYKTNAETAFNAKKRDKINNAEKAARLAYSKIIAEGETSAQNLKAELMKRTEKLSEKVVERILSGNR